MWNLPPPPGFQVLLPNQPLTMYLRHLPHWRQDGATYIVTFRLHDSLPQEKLRALAAYRADWQRRNPAPHTKEQLESLAHETMRRVEHWLDEGMGGCALKDPLASAEVQKALHHFDGQRYELGAYVVMPNHAHAIVRPLLCDTFPLEHILQSWKRHTGREINRLLGTSGPFWQDETFDRIIRDEEHLYRAIQYIGANPRKAGLAPDKCPRWVRPEWVALGWKFEDG